MQNEAICKGLESPVYHFDIEKHKFGYDPLGKKILGVPFSKIKGNREQKRQSKDKRSYDNVIEAKETTLPKSTCVKIGK